VSAFFEEAIEAPFVETGFVAALTTLTGVVFDPEEDCCLAFAGADLALTKTAVALAGSVLAFVEDALAGDDLAFEGAGLDALALAGIALAVARAVLALTGAVLALTRAGLALAEAGFVPVEACFSATFLMGAGLPSDFAGLDLGIKLGSKVSRLCWRNSGGGKK